jgi:hypothetical protein
MQNVVTIGKRLVPVEQIAFVEPFDASSNPEFKPDRPFRARVVLVNRDTVLTEHTPHEFAGLQGFHMLDDDGIAVNPAIAFHVETFAPTEAFNPAKAYSTRLKWRDCDGNEQSKLLLTKPEIAISVIQRRGSEARHGLPPRPGRTRRAGLDESSLIAD